MTKSFQFILFMLYLLPGALGLAQDPSLITPSTLKLERAYRDVDGNIVVSFASDQRSGQRSGLDMNRMFWGPRDEPGKLYQLKAEGFMKPEGSIDSGARFSFLAPSVSNPNHTEVIDLKETISAATDCSPLARCFMRMSEAGERALAESIRSGELDLQALPWSRKIEFAFRVEGTDAFVIVDSNRYLDLAANRIEVFIVSKGRLDSVPVRHIQRSSGDGTWLIELNAHHPELGRVRGIFVPGTQRPHLRAMLVDNTAVLRGKDLTAVKLTLDELSRLGFDANRYRFIELKTPDLTALRCEGLFSF